MRHIGVAVALLGIVVFAGTGKAHAQYIIEQAVLNSPAQGATFTPSSATECHVPFASSIFHTVGMYGPYNGTWSWSMGMSAWAGTFSNPGLPPLAIQFLPASGNKETEAGSESVNLAEGQSSVKGAFLTATANYTPRTSSYTGTARATAYGTYTGAFPHNPFVQDVTFTINTYTP